MIKRAPAYLSLLSSAFAVASVVACSSSSSTLDSSRDGSMAGGEGGADGDAIDATSGEGDASSVGDASGDTLSACFTISNTTTGITSGCGLSCADCTGSALTDGTYIMTEWAPSTMSSGCNSDNALSHGKVVVSAGVIEWVTDANNGAPFTQIDHSQVRASYTIGAGDGGVVEGAVLHLTSLCGAAPSDMAFGTNASGDLVLGQGHFVRQ